MTDEPEPQAGATVVSRPEVVAAARWWADQLAGPAEHHIVRPGEPGAVSGAFVSAASSVAARQFTAEEVEAFRVALEAELERHVDAHGWAKAVAEGPLWGSAMRCIGNDYGPDPVLADAAQAAGLKLTMFDLPMKTAMWINPGSVTVAGGYQAGPAQIFRAAEEGAR